MTTARRSYRSRQSHGPRVAGGDMMLCRECGSLKPTEAFRVLKSGSHESYCRDCHNAINRAWRTRAREDRSARYRTAHPRRIYAVRNCESCGAVFVPGVHNQRYCDAKCKRAAALRHMTPRRREAHLVLMRLRPAVVEAYGAECHLCAKPIALDAHYLRGDALTLDHVVPVARGGEDTIANLRPAHRACNIRRGTRELVA